MSFLTLMWSRDDMYTPDSVEQLQKAGIDFQRHEEIGIMPNDFAELMITSGLVLSPDTRWISFHRCVLCGFLATAHSLTLRSFSYSGYDFGYFVKLLTAQSLPTTEDAFFDLLKLWFPTVYDIKYLMKASKVLKGGLQEVADDLGVCYVKSWFYWSWSDLYSKVMRIGASQQAGSDSLLTASTFFKMREIYFDDRIDDEEYSGKLYGLGQTFSMANGFTDPSRGGATIAERDDRSSTGREAQNQTPGPNGGTTQTQPVPMSISALQGGVPTSITPGGYGPLTNGPGPYLRTMVGGR